ncbi:MAG: class I SAM-dependent methyltransferase [Gammaproteobacteria bacterium]|nr:class I SAM-dependent methyltransferase [Gammaproteobacteria bacterium]MDH5305322.1 class I SAM-dependent methyltransferase [Gammaproteobacteria bacterium]MDH5323288.1 class I SAM-dependent methyltransferase [Gammaproteobacteria bacterium]
MTERIEQLKKDWDERSERLGATQRAVLFKRFPDWLNKSIHRRHVRFITENIAQGSGQVLDVGCGYGRLSLELAARFPSFTFQGVDLCTEFANEYERSVGRCYNGPIQDFRTDARFDFILIVTTLMYLTEKEHEEVLTRLWSMLASKGRIVCIEPASELFQLWRRLTGRESASPTGGTIHHFLRRQLEDKFSSLAGARVIASQAVNILPFFATTAVHHCVAIEKA